MSCLCLLLAWRHHKVFCQSFCGSHPGLLSPLTRRVMQNELSWGFCKFNGNYVLLYFISWSLDHSQFFTCHDSIAVVSCTKNLFNQNFSENELKFPSNLQIPHIVSKMVPKMDAPCQGAASWALCMQGGFQVIGWLGDDQADASVWMWGT